RNKMLGEQTDAKITDPFNPDAFNFQPMTGSPVFNASSWTTTPVIDFDVAANTNMVRNYPNPFKGTTNIEIQIRKTENVRIVIFNISGAVVSEIQNGKLYDGTYDFIFDASQLPGGLYFGKVIMGNEVQTLKMMAQ
ncbi:MAG TPA: T9SS type A sorting domain-containing protein, partial [Draconibacterium sp.]|nr:T9SS type A sorting domain-containing protein [Draconibacterium sp.]